MDLKSVFWQVKMAKDSQQYTAFTVGSMGVYEFLRMPYGLCNIPATFQRLMQNCLSELNLTYALIYLDDVIVFSRTKEEHLHCLQVVFGCFLEHGLQLKPAKCHFLQDKITFLGHEISADGMKPGTANLKAIAEMAPPKMYTEIQRFTGMTEFCGKVIAAMCSLLGAEKIRTTLYHPQTNGPAERVHQTLQLMIGKLDREKRKKWPAHIGSIIIAYNSTRSLVTGYSPYYLMFG